VVDPSFLELVRLGVKRADDPNILQTLPVVDQQLRYTGTCAGG
jgi:glucoamylase